MAWMHHNKLRVNAQMPDDLPAETLDLYREQGWASGLHKDTDPDDRWTDVPRVLPEDDVPPPPPPPPPPNHPRPVGRQTKKG